VSGAQPPEAPPEEQAPRSEAERPFLSIVKGDATPEEVAALVAAVTALSSAAAPPPRRPTPEWSAHHRKMRRTLPHGPGGWRSSGLPH